MTWQSKRLAQPETGPFRSPLGFGVLAALVIVLACSASAAAQAPPDNQVETDRPVAADGTPIYTSPHGLLSELVGRRRSGLLLQGMDQLVGVTATGLSPILVVSFTGPVVYWLTDPADRPDLVFLYQPWFFTLAIVMSLLVLLKDTILTFASYLKLPFDILGILFHGLGFLLGFRLIYQLMDIPAEPGGGGGMGLVGLGLLALMYLFYVSVWVLSNAFEILILLSPIPLVDTVLRIGRGVVIIGMYLLCWVHPLLGLLVALPVIIVSLVLFERTLRLSWLGSRICWDLVARRNQPVSDETPHLMAFTGLFGGHLPMFTLGQLVFSQGAWRFRARRLVVGPWKYYPVSLEPVVVAQGTLYPAIAREDGNQSRIVLRLLPAYRGQEGQVARRMGTDKVIDRTWGTSAKSSWQAIRGLWASLRRKGNGNVPSDDPTVG